MSLAREDRLGATLLADGRTVFTLWAPARAEVDLVIDGARVERMAAADHGYHRAILERVPAGSRYLYRLAADVERPDPASRSQPAGVHGPSEVVDLGFSWTDQGFTNLPLASYVIYELHVGTFTPEGTFDAIVPHLDRLSGLGVTALELMPVAEFPGTRNWGYDGVLPFCVHAAYGGAQGLKRLVDACHQRGLAVVLDVVYNHLGPEGNYLADFGPYYTDVYRTPWGRALNFDGPGSDAVRRYFIENARAWVSDFHVDALRLDAVQAIFDHSARPFLEELADEVHALGAELGRSVYLIAETDQNDPKLIRAAARGGYGLDSMWCDDLHHATHVLLTGEKTGYYEDYGRVAHLALAWEQGMTYAGSYSTFRGRRHGRALEDPKPHEIVVSVQTHDQVGNRLLGERLGALVDLEGEKLAAGIVLLSPFVPLLFMGQEYGETAPFQYFVGHGDPALVKAVRRGRKEEARRFGWRGDVPDPDGEETFRRSVLSHERRREGRHAVLFSLYAELLALRARLATSGIDRALAFETERVLFVERPGRAVFLFHFGSDRVALSLPLPPGIFRRAFDSADPRWQGPGSELPTVLAWDPRARLSLEPRSFAVYLHEPEMPSSPLAGSLR